MMKIKLMLLMMLVGFTSQLQAGLLATNNDNVIVSSGDYYSGITTKKNATVNMVGGTIEMGTISAMRDNAQFNISGGTISGEVYLYGYSQMVVSGSDFHIGTFAVGLGELDLNYLASVGALDYFQTEADTYTGTVSGVLSDGNSFSIDFRILQFRYGSEPETANITLVPEPMSMSLLGLGCLFIYRRNTGK